jgi:hypothetical protein
LILFCFFIFTFVIFIVAREGFIIGNMSLVSDSIEPLSSIQQHQFFPFARDFEFGLFFTALASRANVR